MGMMIIAVPVMMVNMNFLALAFDAADRSAPHPFQRDLPGAFPGIPLAAGPEGTSRGHILYIRLRPLQRYKSILRHSPPQRPGVGVTQRFF